MSVLLPVFGVSHFLSLAHFAFSSPFSLSSLHLSPTFSASPVTSFNLPSSPALYTFLLLPPSQYFAQCRAVFLLACASALRAARFVLFPRLTGGDREQRGVKEKSDKGAVEGGRESSLWQEQWKQARQDERQRERWGGGGGGRDTETSGNRLEQDDWRWKTGWEKREVMGGKWWSREVKEKMRIESR